MSSTHNPLVLAIDQGSQSTKVALIDARGTIVARAQKPLRPYEYPQPGHVVHPDDDLWDSLATACRDLIEANPQEVANIKAVGLGSIRFCRALLDENGHLTEPLLSWMDARVGQPLSSENNATYVTTSTGYLTHRLTGATTDTAANYQGMWPFDAATGTWSTNESDYERTGMARHQLFDLIEPGQTLGHITAAAAQTTTIPAGLPVIATANDKAVEALGYGLIEPGTTLISLGTYIAAMTPSTGRANDGGASYWVNSAAVPGQYLYESNGIRRGMWTVGWFRDLVGLSGDGAEAILNNEAADVSPGCNGLVALLDWLAPSDKPFRRGALLGFDGTQGRGAIYRAILEGIAMTMAEHLEQMEQALAAQGLAKPAARVAIGGGGAKSDLMMSILADVLNRPTYRTKIADGALLGSAICAAVGAGAEVGLHADWRGAVRAMVSEGEAFEPDPTRVARYATLRGRYARLRDATDPIFATNSD